MGGEQPETEAFPSEPPSIELPPSEHRSHEASEPNEEPQEETGNEEECTPTIVDEEVPLDGTDVPVPVSDDDLLVAFGDDVRLGTDHKGWEILLTNPIDLPVEGAKQVCENVEIFEVFMASKPKKQHVEVRYRDLDRKERQLFDEAKRKEVQAWVDHGTVKKLTKGTLNPEQIMRCRWILTGGGEESSTRTHRISRKG